MIKHAWNQVNFKKKRDLYISVSTHASLHLLHTYVHKKQSRLHTCKITHFNNNELKRGDHFSFKLTNPQKKIIYIVQNLGISFCIEFQETDPVFSHELI